MPNAIIEDYKYKTTVVNKLSGGNSHIYELTLSDGTVGDYFSTEHPIKKAIGDEIEYELVPNANPAYAQRIKEILPKKPVNFSGNGNKKNESAENARTALIVAKEIFMAGKAEMKMSDLADHLFDWLQKKSKVVN